MKALTLCALLATACSLPAWEIQCYPDAVRADAQGKPIEADRPEKRTTAFFAYEPNERRVRLRCGRGGYASFHLVVQDERGGPFRVTVDEFSRVDVELYREFYNVDGRTGIAYPDALIPIRAGETLDLPAKDNGLKDQTAQGIWVDVWVPTALRQNAHLTLSVWNKSVRLPVEVDLIVEDVVYPAADAVTADHNAYGIGFIGGSHPRIVKQVERDFWVSDPCFRLIQSYHRMFYEHRGTFHQLGYNHSGGVHPAFAPELEGDGAARRVKSWDAFDRHYGPLLDGNAFAGTRRGPRPVEGIYLPINPEWPARFFQWGTPAYEAEFVNVVSEMEQHFREQGWTGTGFEMFFNHKKRYKGFSWDGDETRFPEDDAYFRLYAGMLTKAVPPGSPVKFRFRHDASWRMRSQVDTLKGAVNHWVFAGFVNIYPELPKKVQKRGDTAWIYGGTSGIYGPAAAIAEMPYHAWLTGMDGYTRWLTVDGRADVPAKDYSGDTCMVYSGEAFGIDGPIPSIRLKLERNALQDVALLKAAERQATADYERGEVVRERVAGIFGLRLEELYRPDSELKKQQPWEWSNASFAGNTGAGLFAKASPDSDLLDRLRHYAFDAYATWHVKAEGTPAYALHGPPPPMRDYKPAAAAVTQPEAPPPDRAAFIADLKKYGAACVREVSAADCLKIVPEKYVPLLFRKDPRDPWADSDNYNVDPAAFDKVKRMLALIAAGAPYKLDCNLWLVLTREPLVVHAAIRQVNGRSVHYQWGALHNKPEGEQAQVLETGQVAVAAREGNGPSSVLVPILHEKKVVGWFEVCANFSEYAKSVPAK
ncbi:MAG: DUF4091 domain-containing protein [Planctomycetota bacterium]|nr:DUF4091 domain-containing protein [Planctomycetota bacterium]